MRGRLPYTDEGSGVRRPLEPVRLVPLGFPDPPRTLGSPEGPRKTLRTPLVSESRRKEL